MVQLGSLTGLAPGESVYAVRFMGERLYVVTFLQVDPLFVIDLSDAAAPTLLGQLKIPGYSDYLHPLNASHLIGVGKDAEVTGRVLGLKLALFDASDVSNPREAFTTVVGARGTDSEALRDHKAFVYDDVRRLLVLPLTLYGEAGGTADDDYYDSPQSPDAVCDERWAAGTHSADTRWAPDEVMLWRGAAVWRVGDAAHAGDHGGQRDRPQPDRVRGVPAGLRPAGADVDDGDDGHGLRADRRRRRRAAVGRRPGR